VLTWLWGNQNVSSWGDKGEGAIGTCTKYRERSESKRKRRPEKKQMDFSDRSARGGYPFTIRSGGPSTRPNKDQNHEKGEKKRHSFEKERKNRSKVKESSKNIESIHHIT